MKTGKTAGANPSALLNGDQRRGERRTGRERRGGLRWDPRQTERRISGERRVPVRQAPAGPGTAVTPEPGGRSAPP